MKKKTLLITGASLGLAVLASAALMLTGVIASPFSTRHGPPQQDSVIDETQRAEVVANLIANLDRFYIFPDKAAQMTARLRVRQQAGDYQQITSAEAFAATLSDDLQAIADDRHLRVGYSHALLPEVDDQAPVAATAEELAELRRVNFGVHAVDRLEYNIGYIDLRAFAPPDLVASRLAAAMTLLGDTRALIIDLRANQGGDPETVALLASYLFDKRTHLNDIQHRDGDRKQEFWTRDQVSGPRYGRTRKVYVLIGHDTFSAGEDFAYALKNLKRATLIGEATGGGAHPGEIRRLNPHFGVFVSSGRAVSPITNSNWEGVGVTPDVAIDADKALEQAQTLILTDFLATEKDELWRGLLKESLADLD